MLTLLLGPDDFSKNEYVDGLGGKSPQVVIFDGSEGFGGVDSLAQVDLFGGDKVYVLKNLLKEVNKEQNIEKLTNSKQQIVIVEEKLDKRLSENKQFLANKHIIVKEFNLPHGRELDAWIINRVKSLGGQIMPATAEVLALRLGRDNAKETKFGGKVVASEEVYDLWQADGEIKKLLAHASGAEISTADVKALVPENQEVDVFNLTNAIGDNQKQKAIDLLHLFLKNQTGADEKTAAIQLNALFSEQFRNVAMVQDFVARKTSEAEILDKTGWKSGRLFVMKKIAGRFPASKILDFLNKLSALDDELKTSTTPPKVLLDLIVSQLLS